MSYSGTNAAEDIKPDIPNGDVAMHSSGQSGATSAQPSANQKEADVDAAQVTAEMAASQSDKDLQTASQSGGLAQATVSQSSDGDSKPCDSKLDDKGGDAVKNEWLQVPDNQKKLKALLGKTHPLVRAAAREEEQPGEQLSAKPVRIETAEESQKQNSLGEWRPSSDGSVTLWYLLMQQPLLLSLVKTSLLYNGPQRLQVVFFGGVNF